MESDEIIGSMLGNYRVTAKLGQGGMGAVYLAEHPMLGRKAAVKVLLPELSQHTESVRRFFHEARTTAQLRHPAMVDVFDFGTLGDGRAFLVMDYLEGECLAARIDERGPLPLAEALQVVRQIALGLSVAHAEQIVHRDLKPDNVFLLPPVAGSQELRVKILDFGIAKLGRVNESVRMTRTGMLIGTPLFMSPEQCRGDVEIDERADIYSLGCILFTTLTARPPFVGESLLALIAAHQSAPPPTLASAGVAVPEGVERLVADLLAKEPADRPPSMLAVAERIQALERAGGEPGRITAPIAGGGRARTLKGNPPGPAVPTAFATAEAVAAAAPAAPTKSARPSGKTLSGTTVAVTSPPPEPHKGRLGRLAIAGGLAVTLAVGLALYLRGRAQPMPGSQGTTAAAPSTPASAPPAPERPHPTTVPAPATPPPTTSPPSTTTVTPAKPPTPTSASTRVLTPTADANTPAPRAVAPAEAEARPPKPRRPVYRGTQLEIEKKAPY